MDEGTRSSSFYQDERVENGRPPAEGLSGGGQPSGRKGERPPGLETATGHDRMEREMSAKGCVLVIDDEEVMREILDSLLTHDGYRVKLASSGAEGLEIASREPVDLAIVDVMLPDQSGIDVLEKLKSSDPEMVVAMITAFASVETAIEAMKRGAFDYVTKPFKNDEVRVVVANGMHQRRLVDENRTLKEALHDRQRFDVLVGKSSRMQEVYSLIQQVAPSKSTVLITGESGTGKELVAKAIHNYSSRKQKPFLPMNTGSLPPDLLESNLFGHVKGAFTGAVSPKKGLFEIADGGSIFLDEIGTIPLETQAKLLRVIQEREFMRLGGVDVIRVDVRIIAATNSDLKTLVDEGLFREDLYYRLNVINIFLPPLRQRKEDIPLLAQHFLKKYEQENGRSGLQLSSEAAQSLLDYDWPGNVRELENVIERAVVLADGPILNRRLIPEHVRSGPQFRLPTVVVPEEGISFRDVVSGLEKRLIESSLKTSGGVQKKAAQLLGLKPTTLNEMIKRYNIILERKEPSSTR
jgi:two-component system response regulator PilR (NtrC family)